MLRNSYRSVLGLLALSIACTEALAEQCSSYEELGINLEKQYGEQRVFSGFANREGDKAAATIYEFWSNPERSTWSLVAHKLLQVHYEGRQITRECAFVVRSGNRHRLADKEVAVTDSAQPAVAGQEVSAASALSYLQSPGCVSPSSSARALKERYGEEPVLRALTEDGAIIEIHGGHSSWTITGAWIREARNPITGAMLRDTSTGQEIHQLCSVALFSGKSWGLFSIQEDAI